MKTTASKWPITVTIELADDYFDGIPEDCVDKEAFFNAPVVQTLADTWSRLFIQAKGQTLAQNEAECKQKKVNDK